MHPIHNHSEYSALDGYSTTKEIAQRISDMGLPGAFLTDHGTVAGWRSFKEQMDKQGLFSGFGVEAYQAAVHRQARPDHNQRDASHLILLAKNMTGVRNIMRLTDEANRSGFYYHPRVDWGLLEQYHEGIICTSACQAGLVSKGVVTGSNDALNRYLKIFGDDFFIEMHTYDSEDQFETNCALANIAQERGIGMVYANDAHYCKLDDYESHELLLCMQMAKWIEDPDRMSHPPCLYIMDDEAVRKNLCYLQPNEIDQCIDNSDLIASMCNVEFPKPKLHLPVYMPQDVRSENNTTRLIDAVEQGMNRLVPGASEEYWERAEMEMEVIIDAGLADYFLITAFDLCQWADSQDIARGPGRGSVGGSLVAYLLGITDIDPIKYGLFFERFYNAGRDEGLPDIDIDFEKARRDEVDDHLREIYGEFSVISIGTHIRMKPKAVIDKLAKALYGEQTNYADITNIKKIIDAIPDINIIAGDMIGWHAGEGIVVSVLDDEGAAEALAPYISKYPDLFAYAERIGGRISTYGVHASAIVLSDVDLRTELPGMARVPRDDDGEKSERVIATQVEMREVEKLGFPKFDRLGLRTLDTLKQIAPLQEYRDIDWDAMPEEMWELMDRGCTLGLFQVEDGTAKHIAKKLKPRNMLDLAAIVALNRPGPLRTGVVERFIACRNGEREPSYAHPILEPILELTYGDFLYQEQVIAYFRAIGYDLKEADGIRKMLGKKLVDAMRAEHPRYMQRATEVMDEPTAQLIWDNIVDFSKYSFNLAHAVGYGILLGRTLYAKWKYPTKFIMACIRTNPKRAGDYVSEGRRLGVVIQPPDINRSGVFIEQIDDEIWYGLRDVKGVGEAAAQWIIDHRPYRDSSHFDFKQDAAADKWKSTSKANRSPRSPRQTCTAGVVKALYNVGAFDMLEERDATLTQKAEFQQNLLGVVLLDDIEDIKEFNTEKLGECDRIVDLDQPEHFEETLRVPGVIQSIRQINSRNGNAMGFVKIEWDGDEAEICVSPKHWDAYKFLLRPRTVAIWSVTPQDRGLSFNGAVKLQATE